MTPTHSDLARVLAALKLYANGADVYCQVSEEAARLLREMAADFAWAAEVLPNYNWMRESEDLNEAVRAKLRAARKRWRLPE